MASDRMRHVLGVAVALMLVGALAAVVFVSSDDVSARTAVRLAAQQMDDVDSLRMEMSAVMRVTSGQNTEMEFSQRGEGIFDVQARRGRMTMQFAPVGEMEILTIGDELYLRISDQMRTALGATTPWVAVPLPQAAVSPGGTASMFGGAVALEQLRRMAGSGEVEAVGTDDVRGDPTTRYRIRLTVADLRGLAREAELVPDAEASLPDASGVHLELDVWVDNDLDLVRRQRVTLQFGELPGAGGLANMQMTTTTEFFDFGVDVPAIETPPDDQVTRMADPSDALVPTQPQP